MAAPATSTLPADPALAEALRAAEHAAAMVGAPVLVAGESGVGKSRVVEHLAACAGRRVVRVNAAHLEGARVLADLCGVVRGAYTGANTTRDGLLAEAAGQILWIDEVHHLPRDAQKALLTILDTGEYRRVGEVATRSVELWVVCSTNRDVWAAVDSGELLYDFVHRILNRLRIELAPVRHRPEAIADIATEAAARWGYTLSSAALAWLQRGTWERTDHPGNARQLQGVVMRAAHAARMAGELDTLEPRHFGATASRPVRQGRAPAPGQSRQPSDDLAVLVAEHPGLSTPALAERLGVSERTVRDRARRDPRIGQTHGRRSGWWPVDPGAGCDPEL